MGGRGTFAAGHEVEYTYETIGTINGVKVLRGINGKHGLPESAHSSTAYIKLDNNGVFREMRFYDKNHVLYLEIAYHPEVSLTGNRHTPVLHYHTYDPLFSKTKQKGKLRSDAIKLPGGMKKRLSKYFKGVKL